MKLEKLKSFESQMISEEKTKKLFGGIFSFPSGLEGLTGPGEISVGTGPGCQCISYTHDYQSSGRPTDYYNVRDANKPC